MARSHMTAPGGKSVLPVLDFEGLYRTYSRDVHRFALFLSGDHAAADDIVSETFIRLWSARARVDLATVKAYLFAIARNLFLQRLRHERRNTVLDDRVVDVQPGPEEQVSARRELQSVLDALQTLPEVDRSAVLMRAEDNLSYEEIAAALGISISAAKVKVHRARLKLAEARLGGGLAVRPKESLT
jgi:RNA polymerase sigma-70 factor (ECF subfamily)